MKPLVRFLQGETGLRQILPIMLSASGSRYSSVGIERVAVVDDSPVSRVDLMTRDADHAAALEDNFGIRPFRFERRGETVFSFARLPAPAVRAWMEDQGLSFERTDGGLGQPSVRTWIQAGQR